MSRLLLIGAGSAGSVVAQKCARDRAHFEHICIASRRIESCQAVAQLCAGPVDIAQLDANDTAQVVALIEKFKPDLVVNMALPYQDLSIMDACLATKVPYLDTANYEPPDEAKFEYKWQWAYQDKFKSAGVLALLGSGFDPGVTNVFCAYAQKHYFDEIECIDILDCNAGDHGHPFATNFNPEINIREITQNGRYWENGNWIETLPLSISEPYDYPAVGPKQSYLMYHEELESLAKNIRGLKRIRFWMTFSENYLTHLRVLENVGMTSITPIQYNGQAIQPLQFLKAVLPSPSSLGENYTGKTSIGCEFVGKKNGKKRRIRIFNVCEHQKCYSECKAQAVSYTTGVPAYIGAKMIVSGAWKGPGVFNIEEFDPDPFMAALNQDGLPWHVEELDPAHTWH